MLIFNFIGNGYRVTRQAEPLETDIIIPSTFDDGINGEFPVTTIGWAAFGANQLTSVTIPSSVTVITDFAFQNNQLTSVVIPNSVTNIGGRAFADNQLTSVVWETGVNIPLGAFLGIDNKITSFTITSDTLIALTNINAFDGVTVEQPMTVYVQPQLIEDYKVATNWSDLYNDGRVVFEVLVGPSKSRKLGTLYANLESTEFTTLKAVKKETVEALVESDSLELNTLYVDNSESNTFTDLDKNKVDIISINGDGTQYLADDGTYKEISDGGSSSRIQNDNNTQWVDTDSNNIALYLKPTMGDGGEYSFGRNHFKLGVVREYAPINNSYVYNIGTKNDGSIDVDLSDNQINNELGYPPFEKYTFDYFYRNNPNQVMRKFEVDLAIQQAIEDVLLGEV